MLETPGETGWLSCKILAEKKVILQDSGRNIAILQDSGRNLARLCIILQDNHSVSAGEISKMSYLAVFFQNDHERKMMQFS